MEEPSFSIDRLLCNTQSLCLQVFAGIWPTILGTGTLFAVGILAAVILHIITD
ncbi:MAG TPA: hypothetical protein VJN92_07735 [Candidatus Acidoferrum sp.]|nr:hypothetical protein [Candidatus Acidoferrum sp.]